MCVPLAAQHVRVLQRERDAEKTRTTPVQIRGDPWPDRIREDPWPDSSVALQLLTAERCQRIEARGATGWQVAGRERDA
jgi:hypothetical protein